MRHTNAHHHRSTDVKLNFRPVRLSVWPTRRSPGRMEKFTQMCTQFAFILLHKFVAYRPHFAATQLWSCPGPSIKSQANIFFCSTSRSECGTNWFLIRQDQGTQAPSPTMAQMSGAMGIRLNPNKLRNKARKQGQSKFESENPAKIYDSHENICILLAKFYKQHGAIASQKRWQPHNENAFS